MKHSRLGESPDPGGTWEEHCPCPAKDPELWMGAHRHPRCAESLDRGMKKQSGADPDPLLWWPRSILHWGSWSLKEPRELETVAISSGCSALRPLVCPLSVSALSEGPPPGWVVVQLSRGTQRRMPVAKERSRCHLCATPRPGKLLS